MKRRIAIVLVLCCLLLPALAQQPTAGQYNTSQPTPAATQQTTLQQDQAANLLNFPGLSFEAGAQWGTGTSQNTLQYPTGTTTQGQLSGAPAVIVQLDISNSTFTAGAVTFQGTYDNSNWVSIPVAQVLNPNTFAQLTNPYTFVANTNQPFLIVTSGYVSIRAKLTTAITGSSTPTVNPYWATLPNEKSLIAPLPAGANNIGAIDVFGHAGGIFDTSAGATAAANSIEAGGVYNSSAPGPSNGQQEPLQLDSAANLKVNVAATALPTAILAGQQAVTASAAALATNTLTKGLCIEALSTNTISVFVGPSGVTTSTGIELPAKAGFCIAVANSNDIYVIASTTGATVTWSGN